MSNEEKLNYHRHLGERLQEHRYRYYVLDNPVLEDFVYDHIERVYKEVSREMNLKDVAIDMVGFDSNVLGALQAANRVLEGLDHYSTIQKALQEVWEELGPPKYIRNEEKEKK